MKNLTATARREIREIKRLIKINNIILAIDSRCAQGPKFLANCSRINTLLNGEKYNINISD